MAGFVKVATTDELISGKLKEVKVGNIDIVVGNKDGTYFALDNICSHEECPLSDGFFEDLFLVCSCHGAKYDIKTGKADRSIPYGTEQKVFQIKVEGRDILVKV